MTETSGNPPGKRGFLSIYGPEGQISGIESVFRSLEIVAMISIGVIEIGLTGAKVTRVIPAKAGIHLQATRTKPKKRWTAFAGMTSSVG